MFYVTVAHLYLHIFTKFHLATDTPPAFNAPVRGVSVGILPSRLVWKNQNGGEPYPMVRKL